MRSCFIIDFLIGLKFVIFCRYTEELVRGYEVMTSNFQSNFWATENDIKMLIFSSQINPFVG